MTIEASFVLPLLLCAFMGIVMLGKLFLVSQGMDMALLETARQIARKEHVLTAHGQEGEGIFLAPAIFQKVKDQGDGTTGLEVTGVSFTGSKYLASSKELLLSVTYKVGKKNGDYVYITEDGEAYHEDGQCYHLHISVKAVNNTKKYYDGDTALRPCEYCVEGTKRKTVLYIPREGECYHEAIDCSGLTRRVTSVARSETEGRIPCEDCCKKE